MNKLLCIGLLIAGTSLLHGQTDLRSEIEKLLPSSECKVDIMDLAVSKRSLELTMKIQTAIATNKDWFLAQVKSAKPGPLPYDERLGLTKEEYAEFLSLGQKTEMQKVANGELKPTKDIDIFQFHAGSNLRSLNEVKISLKDLTIMTPFGILKNPEPAESKGGGALGGYSGYRWHFEAGDAEKGDITTASFLIGKLEKSEKRFVYYKHSIAKSNNPVSNTTVVIYYDKD